MRGSCPRSTWTGMAPNVAAVVPDRPAVRMAKLQTPH